MKWLDRLFGGSKNMPALAGAKAPDFSLPTLDGGKFSLQDALQRGPVLAAFFKVSCPVCQYTFPFLERLHEAYGSQNVAMVSISQNDKRDTTAFVREYGVTFPTLLDDSAGYEASNAYGLTNVPSWFLIGTDGKTKIASVGWVKADMEALNRQLSETNHASLRPLFRPDEDVRDFWPG